LGNPGEFGTANEIFQLAAVIYCDDLPDSSTQADAAVIFGKTIANTHSLTEALVRIYMEEKVRERESIGISAGFSLGEKIVPSYEELVEILRRDIPVGDVVFQFPLSEKFLPSTDADAWGLVGYAQERGMKSVILVAPPLHKFRAFVSLASAIIKAKSGLIAWNWTCDIRDWNEKTVHSQTAPLDKRLNLLAGELEKIGRYYRKGDLVSAREILDYVARRYG